MALVDNVWIDSVAPNKSSIRSYHRAREYISSLDAEFGSLSVGSLQAGINAAASGLREYVFQGGDYDVGSSTLSIPSNSRIRMNGNVRFIRSINGAVPVFYATGKSNIRMDGGFTVEHTGSGDAASADSAGMYFDNCTDVEVEDPIVKGKFYVGIVFAQCDGWALVRPKVRGVQNRGIYPYLSTKHGSINQPHVDGRVVGGTTPVTAYGINYNAGGSGRIIDDVNVYGGSVHHCTHQGVEFGDQMTGCGAYGVTVHDITQFYGFLVQLANGSAAHRTRISGCAAYRCAVSGCFISETFFVTVTGGYFSQNTLDGVTLNNAQNCTVSGIVADNNPQAGVNIINGSARNQVNGGCQIYANGIGVALASGTLNNRVTENTIYSNTTSNVANSGTNSIGTNIST